MNLKEMHDAVVMSKVILLGSPTINKTMVKPMWDLFSVIDPMANIGKNRWSIRFLRMEW